MDLNFHGKNPGAVRYGNFINYYQFHPVENRLKLLPFHIWKKDEAFFGLDVGCNAGNLTLALHDTLKHHIQHDCRLLGIDIDPTLIKRAQEKNISDEVNFLCFDFLDIEKRHELISKYLKQHRIKRFSATFCFSITMWIHLNRGDAGLEDFLRVICDISDAVVIEPQPWKCYKTAVKRMKRQNEHFEQFNNIKIREDVDTYIEWFLTENGASKVYESPKTVWDRKIIIFKCK